MNLPPFAGLAPRDDCDPLTGLPAAAALLAALAAPAAGSVADPGLKSGPDPGSSSGPAPGLPPGSGADADFLVLLELYPRTSDAERAMAAIQRAGAYLHSLFAASAPLYSLGWGVFALVWVRVSPEEARHMADLLLHRLQREGFARAHIGLAARRRGAQRQADPEAAARQLLAAAWQALGVARRRGPFGLCVADGARLFPPPAPGERAKLSRLWRARERFALLLICQDQPALSNHFSKRVRAALESEPQTPVLFLSQREIMVYLDGADQAAATGWLTAFRRRMRASQGATFSAGIALYPCPGAGKSRIPVNCRKALLHAELLGPESEAVFNGISLNISGDAYYNEGDIRKAVAEYRLGLNLDPANVNLLNSLGVALAQLKQTRAAIAAFNKALVIEPQNFMALVNLGFAHLAGGRDGEAVHCFERALAVNGRSFDLLLQLGRLYCRHQRYAEAAELLQSCVDDPRIEERRGGDLATAQRLLGQALHALGRDRQAMTAVQRAHNLNPRDPEALSLLGELYFRNGQGAEIALSLCRQAAELAENNGEHWRRLGWVQWRQGLVGEAEVSLRRALRLNRRDGRAAAWLAEVYRQQGRQALAARMESRAARLQ